MQTKSSTVRGAQAPSSWAFMSQSTLSLSTSSEPTHTCAENMLGACMIAVAYKGPLSPPIDEDDAGQVDYLPDGRKVSFESSFSWHDVDLRIPMPSLTELQVADHPIGLLDGKPLYLATARAATKYGAVERSPAFSEYYGTKVYLCQRA